MSESKRWMPFIVWWSNLNIIRVRKMAIVRKKTGSRFLQIPKSTSRVVDITHFAFVQIG